MNFNAGTLSNGGGFLSIKLNENGSFTAEHPTLTESGEYKRIMRTFTYDNPVKNIVYGVGQTIHPVCKKVHAHVL